MFEAALGVTAADAKEFRKTLLEVARTGEAKLGEVDIYGQRFTIDFEMETSIGKAEVRSGWIVLQNENVPRLTTCYVLKRRR